MEPPRASVLLIDDEPNLLVGLTALLERAGYVVATASSGDEGVAAARRRPPDLVLCDVTMPAPDGFAVRQALGADPRTAAIPFLFLTARTDTDDRVRGLEWGADDYITKPFDRRELLARIEAVLRRRELGRREGIGEARLEMERLRDEVTRNIHHELRTPLSVIIAALEIALDGGQVSPDDERQFLEQALRAANHLSELVHNLLRLNGRDEELERGARAALGPEEWLDPVVEECRQRWSRKPFTVVPRIGPDGRPVGPPLAVRYVLEHLLDNAVKFGPAGGTVVVSTDRLPDGGVKVSVADQGPGIPVELREKVFERFFQASQGLSRRHEGLGIGLTLARSVARALGGDVTLADVPSGCRVEFLLPPAGQL